MQINLIWAEARQRVIGNKGEIPWQLPEDLLHFKELTLGNPVIMGRKTFDSLGKALRGRKNIVITRQHGWKADNVIVVKSLDDAIFVAKETDAIEIMVIGGGEIFKIAFEKAKRIYITRVKAELEGDTYFPAIDPKVWQLVSQKDHEADEKHAYEYSFQVWERV